MPLSPVTSTEVRVEWILPMNSNTRCIGRLLPSRRASRTRPAT
ncbi:MAG: hypothetical protein R2939_20480 [Kofleriaceae bacterium]